jgi:polyphosphate kinase 2 (PPK2 family)
MTADNSNSKKMKGKEYEKHLHKLQVELCRLQDWVKAEGMKVIVLFEGRDAAGKGQSPKFTLQISAAYAQNSGGLVSFCPAYILLLAGTD